MPDAPRRHPNSFADPPLEPSLHRCRQPRFLRPIPPVVSAIIVTVPEDFPAFSAKTVIGSAATTTITTTTTITITTIVDVIRIHTEIAMLRLPGDSPVSSEKMPSLPRHLPTPLIPILRPTPKNSPRKTRTSALLLGRPDRSGNGSSIDDSIKGSNRKVSEKPMTRNHVAPWPRRLPNSAVAAAVVAKARTTRQKI